MIVNLKEFIYLYVATDKPTYWSYNTNSKIFK